jgi:squalene-hopene/tetraprenyl-beta-curcumene cyclase
MVRLLATAALSVSLLLGAVAADPAAPPAKAEVEALIAKAQDWLLSQQQPDGAFLPGKQFVVGITAMSVEALATKPLGLTASDPRIAKAIALLKANRQADGGIYAKDEGLGNYGTSFSLLALAAAGDRDEALVKGAQEFLYGAQNSAAGTITDGGIGYGSKGAGHEDLSNTATAVAALKASGVPSSDPHLAKALAFLERCQNLSSHNKLPWVTNDGGAVYSPEESKAEGSWNPKDAGSDGKPAADVKLASYGSMTYALISSYLALDLKPEDPRVAAALAWVKGNYGFEANPGMRPGKELEGLLYYYAAMAKTLSLLELKVIELKDGRKADWRADLFAAISKRAIPAKLADGREGLMWMNSTKRWAESMPQVGTVYLIKALKAIHATL